MDLNVAATNPAVAKWGETRFFGAYNPANNAGIYVHAGRFRKDLDMWWVHLAAYLPDGRIVVDRSWGHDAGREVVRTGVFELQQQDDGFHTVVNGVGEVTSTAELAVAPRGSGAGLARVQWDARFTDFGQLWDLYGGAEKAGVDELAGDSHSQRSFTTAGSLTVDGETFALDGVGWRDHSSGARDWTGGYHGHSFIVAVTDTWACHAVSMLGPDGLPAGKTGSWFDQDGSVAAVEELSMDPIDGPECGPRTGALELKVAGQEPVSVDYEILHQLPIIINDNGDNINGLDWDDPVISIVLGESIARLTFPDGTVAHAFLERGIHRGQLARPISVAAG